MEETRRGGEEDEPLMQPWVSPELWNRNSLLGVDLEDSLYDVW